MSLELPARSAVDVKLVQLRLDATRLCADCIRQEELGYDVDDARIVRTEQGEEFVRVQLAGLAIVLVDNIFSTTAEGCWRAGVKELLEALLVVIRV